MKLSFAMLLLVFSSISFAQSPPTKVEHEQKMNSVGEIAPTVSGLRKTQSSTRGQVLEPSQRGIKSNKEQIAGEPVAPIYKISYLMNLDGDFLAPDGNNFGYNNNLIKSIIIDESGRKVGHLNYFYDMNDRLTKVTRHYDNLQAPVETFEFEYGP